jgi:hypothetical protein
VSAEARGGILADDMGLGKTLTVIALIASDRDPATGRGVTEEEKAEEDEDESSALEAAMRAMRLQVRWPPAPPACCPRWRGWKNICLLARFTYRNGEESHTERNDEEDWSSGGERVSHEKFF